MKKILLTKGKFAIVDNEDFDWLNRWKWHRSHGYAKRSIYLGGGRKNQKSKTIWMHREILEHYGFDISEKQTDHKDLNRLNNQKSNLRVANHQENNYNRNLQVNNTSGYKGVYLCQQKYKHNVYHYWAAQISVGNKIQYLGHFPTKELGAIAYNKAAIKYYGKFARLNSVK